jgi:hypothetical protein
MDRGQSYLQVIIIHAVIVSPFPPSITGIGEYGSMYILPKRLIVEMG